ncbi:hypothetical protein ACFW1F_01380 [Streptomyces bungoensis]|uniref:hypothetical protein n=1 Tax=Streptomyces bungoensis TaxID=285568 RepID=UPI00369A4597
MPTKAHASPAYRRHPCSRVAPHGQRPVAEVASLLGGESYDLEHPAGQPDGSGVEESLSSPVRFSRVVGQPAGVEPQSAVLEELHLDRVFVTH